MFFFNIYYVTLNISKKGVTNIMKIQKGDIKSILYISVVTSLIMFWGSAFFYYFEFGKNAEVENFFDAFWWTVVTTTSLGYGDIYPVTTAGRIVGIFLMFFGIVLIGLIAGSVSRHYIEARKRRNGEL
jgi:voltage-gated potassium channel